jgi:hypothetical protein
MTGPLLNLRRFTDISEPFPGMADTLLLLVPLRIREIQVTAWGADENWLMGTASRGAALLGTHGDRMQYKPDGQAANGLVDALAATAILAHPDGIEIAALGLHLCAHAACPHKTAT